VAEKNVAAGGMKPAWPVVGASQEHLEEGLSMRLCTLVLASAVSGLALAAAAQAGPLGLGGGAGLGGGVGGGLGGAVGGLGGG
jgi:hypothetical protein